ncbi:MAG TPA: flavin reductase family protein [Candidatus Omnitrophota bacterium]|nr:flavin reductase family protein [Candidatus Omnitrophota bacterium]HPS20181.1 flavin reductase family protein [Candidatus Omnitrophota bacterium]
MRVSVDLKYATRLINHGPLVMISSRKGARIDITPVAWHMPVEKVPPVIALEISETHFIYECIMETGDFVVNIPAISALGDIVKCGSVSGRDNDKLKMCGFTLGAAKKIGSPVINESLAIMECVLKKDSYMLKEYNMVIGEVKYAEAEQDAFNEHWIFQSDKMKTVHHLGDKTFCAPAGEIYDLRKKNV